MDCGLKKFVNRLNDAYNHLDCATNFEEVDIAVFEITAAELALSRYVKMSKENDGFV